MWASVSRKFVRLRALPGLRQIDTRIVRPAPKLASEAYRIPEHVAWAKAVKDRDGWQCRDPEHDPRLPRSGIRLHADHIHEIADGGNPHDVANGLTRCSPCH